MDGPLLGIGQEELFGFLITLGIGVLIGVEREYSKKGADRVQEIFAGIRTFPLIAILGHLFMLLGQELSHWIFGIGTFGFMLFVIASYVTSYKEERTGGTTQMAMIIAFLLGGIVQLGHAGVAILGAVLATALLATKLQLHSAIGKIARKDIFALLQFVVLAVLVFPFLPDQAYGPYEVLNPQEIWRIVVIILGIDFLGYLLAKFIGTRRGTVVTGILGGFASSTAVAWSFSRRSRKLSGHAGEFAGGIVLASSIMFPRMLIWLFLWNRDLFMELLLPVVLIGAVGVTFGVLLVRRGGEGKRGVEHEPKNPLNLIGALTFGALYAGILLLVAFAQDRFGDQGVFIASGISGLTDVDAITISMSELGGERFSLFVSHVSIVIAAISNSLLKYALCFFFGSRELKERISFGFLPIIGVALLYLLVKWWVIG